MHAKTMEGLAGASMNMKMMNTPFRVYQEAERRGDTSVMERAMGYVGETADKAEDYQKKVEKGMKEEAKEAREKAKSEQENAIRKRKEEHGEQTDICGKSALPPWHAQGHLACSDCPYISRARSKPVFPIPVETADVVKTEPVIYTKTGEAARPESSTNISVSA